MADYVFPEDAGTTTNYQAGEGDKDDAANFGAHVGSLGSRTGFVLDGLAFPTVDYTNLTFSTSAGHAFVKDDGVDNAQSADTKDNVGYIVGVDSRSSISLTDAAVNHVFVSVDFSGDPDNVSVVANTTGTKPTASSIKIGEIDTSADTKSEQWYLLTDSGHLSFPSETAGDTAAANLLEGTQWYDRDTNSFYKVI